MLQGVWENSYQGVPHRVKRIFVGGLSSDSTEDDIRKYFEQFGKVTHSL
jgi:RNA-binding protein Musashi